MEYVQKIAQGIDVTIDEVKSQLNIEKDFTEDDPFLGIILNTAADFCQGETQRDIFMNDNSHTIYDFEGRGIKLKVTPFRELEEVSFQKDGTSEKVVITGTKIKMGETIVKLEFPYSLSKGTLYLKYKTGYEIGRIPPALKSAILIKTADLYETERQSESSNLLKNNKAVDRLLSAYTVTYF